MISKQCFVFMQLPDSLEVVSVGRLDWQKAGENTEVGTFVYGKSYLERKLFPLDPFVLPLQQKAFSITSNEGIPGPLRDASPDSWGRYVIQKNTPATEHDPVGYLLNSAGDSIGALSFSVDKTPPAPVRKFNHTVDLKKLIAASHKLENGIALDEAEGKLLMVGPSAGGARPKTTVEYENELWIAKFPAANDRQNIARIEYATMKLAGHCGLNVPEVKVTRVGKDDVLLVRRFDRSPKQSSGLFQRTHFVSGLTLLNVDERDRENWSYLELADQMRRWIKKPKGDLEEMFKRVVFNGLVSNTDDHPRNHGFLLVGNGYQLSPAYDLVPKPETGTDRYLAMQIGSTAGRLFGEENLLSRCEAFELSRDKAQEILRRFQKKIFKWRSFFAEQGVSQEDIKYLEGAFSHWENLKGGN